MAEQIYEEMEMWKLSGDARNSMSFWWPRIKNLDIPQPETKRIELDRKAYYNCLFREADQPKGDLENFKKTAESLGFPVFMRTSEMSAKHSWDETCYIEKKGNIKRNFWGLLEDNYLAVDHIPDAVFFRKFIPMESYFTGWYNNFPVNKEVRTFIRNGQMECRHPYWPLGAMEQAKPKDPDWKDKYVKLCTLSSQDKDKIENYSNMVAKEFKDIHNDDGWWSVDFAKGKDSVWYLIDMALGPISAHYWNCPHKPKVRMRDGKIREDKE